MKQERLPRRYAPRNDGRLNGFTLFELLVSISIIAILTAIGIVSFSSAQVKARDSKRMQDMEAIGKAAEMYYSNNSANYPTTWGVGTSWPGVLEAFPLDPKGIAYTDPTLINPAYLTTSGYCFCAYMEGQKGNSSDQNCSFNNVATKSWFCVKNQQ